MKFKEIVLPTILGLIVFFISFDISKLDSKTQIDFKKETLNLLEYLKKISTLENHILPEILISAKTFEQEHKFIYNTQEQNLEKLRRVLLLLVESKIFKKNNKSDFLIVVYKKGNIIFEGSISEDEFKNNIQAQNLLKVMELYANYR